MKIRCTRDSIRLRVRKSELETLRREKHLEEALIVAPDQRLRFQVCTEQVEEIGIAFAGDLLRISLPAEQAGHWMNSEQVGIRERLDNGTETGLEILIEKDFPCEGREEKHPGDYFSELATRQGKDAC